jgi:Fe-S-cluster-containing dehydrogenase component
MTCPILVIDLDACLGCHACATVCKQENNIGIGSLWNKVLEIGPTGKFPDLEMYYLPVLCQQCDNPTCVAVCPTGASYKRADGVILVNHSRCIGCQYCVMACPYGVRSFNHESGMIEKCTLCADRANTQDNPICVKACPAQCRFYGDMDDPTSEVSRAVREAGENVHYLMDVGNHPSAIYILHNQTWRNG